MLPRDGTNKKIMPQLTFVDEDAGVTFNTQEIYYIHYQKWCIVVAVTQEHFRVFLEGVLEFICIFELCQSSGHSDAASCCCGVAICSLLTKKKNQNFFKKLLFLS